MKSVNMKSDWHAQLYALCKCCCTRESNEQDAEPTIKKIAFFDSDAPPPARFHRPSLPPPPITKWFKEGDPRQFPVCSGRWGTFAYDVLSPRTICIPCISHLDSVVGRVEFSDPDAEIVVITFPLKAQIRGIGCLKVLGLPVWWGAVFVVPQLLLAVVRSSNKVHTYIHTLVVIPRSRATKKVQLLFLHADPILFRCWKRCGRVPPLAQAMNVRLTLRQSRCVLI